MNNAPQRRQKRRGCLKMARVARCAHRVPCLKEGEESCSMPGQCSTSTRAKQPGDYLPRVPCCATESSALFGPHHTRIPLLPSTLTNTSSSCATENSQPVLRYRSVFSRRCAKAPACAHVLDITTGCDA